MHVFVHVDADPSDSQLCRIKGSGRSSHAPPLKWDGLTFTLDFFETFRDKIKGLGLEFKATFFIRADEQIRNLYGAYSDIFIEFHNDVGKHFSKGWHPHLLRWSKVAQCWGQEFRDIEWMRRVLTDCVEDLKAHGFEVRFTKMGWCYHNNTTMQTLSNLGVEADFSALPGAKRPGRLIEGKSLQDKFDWSRTGSKPYHPNEHDYQKPGSLRILEIPLTTLGVRGFDTFLYSVKLALASYLRLDFSYIPSFSMMTPLILPDLVKSLNQDEVCEILFGEKESRYITLYLHPDDLLVTDRRTAFEDFISKLIDVASKNDVKVVFDDAVQLYNYCMQII